ncbi:MAG: LysM peptidoglycan-binding domain-containing protein [Bacilli bacterium]|nr:LysM peptidoglycan-binding domain-containing protein [Bacilli bacterium]
MKEIVSFKKEIDFNTMLEKITSISLEHTLGLTEDKNIKGDVIVSGTYKQTEASQIDNPFSYKIPVDIELDDKYDLTNLIIDIDDFTYEVLNDNKLKINVDLLLDKLELKKIENDDEIISIDDLFLDKTEDEKLEIPDAKVEEQKEVKEEQKEVKEEKGEEQEEKNEEQEEIELDKTSNSLFSNLDNTNETYKAYHVYIMRENDTINTIIEKYKTKKEDLEEYNNLQELKIGSKVIIPSNNEE